jgi:ribosome maturation factor RimP
MSKPTDLIIGEITRLIEPIVEEADFELVDIEYLSERGRWVLRIYVDKEGGVTLDHCSWLSREIGDLIDVKDVVPHEYVLEVSSPGLNRPLKREKDFLQALGKKVKVKMVTPVKGRKNYTGYLRSFQNGKLFVDINNHLVTLPWRDVEKANLVYEFEN